MAKPKRPDTTPDLVVLALLCERPMHGYEVNRVLEERDVRDWAGISRPQVYYSLKKLEDAEALRLVDSPTQGAGPPREVYEITQKGRRILADALEREAWTSCRGAPPFLTWMALSEHARPPVLLTQIERRRKFLRSELERERETLASFDDNENALEKRAQLMITLTVRHFEVELSWLDEVEAALTP